MDKIIKNFRDGYHFRSQYWVNSKNSRPKKLPDHLFQVALGMTFGDNTLYNTKKEGTAIKIEQGYKNKKYIEELFTLFKEWTFRTHLYEYIPQKGKHMNKVKSYSFKTFAVPAFDFLWEFFIKTPRKGWAPSKCKKTYTPGTIEKHLTAVGFSYWIADDGSLHAKSNEIILNTQGFSKEENVIMCEKLNAKFKLHAIVKPHKQEYYIIYIPASDAPVLCSLLENHLPKSMIHKLLKLKASHKNLSIK